MRNQVKARKTGRDRIGEMAAAITTILQEEGAVSTERLVAAGFTHEEVEALKDKAWTRSLAERGNEI